jgi:hypothetical protein
MRTAAAGVYVPSCEFAHAGHELAQIVLRSKTSREHDGVLVRLLAASAARPFPRFRPDLVVSLPAKPGEEDRFRNIRRELAGTLGASDAGRAVRPTRVIRDYRRMSDAQRRAVAQGPYVAGSAVRAKSVLLIDDVVTSGAQAGDAIRALVAAGAVEVRFACVARNIGPRERRRITSWSPCARRAAGCGRTIRAWLIALFSRSSPWSRCRSARGAQRAVDGSLGEALRWWDDEVSSATAIMGTLGLCPSRPEKHGVAGAVRAKRAP